MNSANLEAFYIAAKLGHFTQAADQLAITQSALSQRIAKLELELETSLFIRDKKSIRLTDAGVQLLRYCQLTSAIEKEFLGKMISSNDALVGHLTIACFSSVGRSLVLPALQSLLVKNHGITLSLINGELNELETKLQRAEADYIVTTLMTDRGDIESVFLGNEEYVLVKSKKHHQSDFFLDHDRMDSTTQSYFAKNKLKYKPQRHHYLDDVYGIIDGVRQGLGQAVLPMHLIENDKDLEILHPRQVLKVPVFLQFFVEPYYRALHEPVIAALKNGFSKKLAR